MRQAKQISSELLRLTEAECGKDEPDRHIVHYLTKALRKLQQAVIIAENAEQERKHATELHKMHCKDHSGNGPTSPIGGYN